MTKDEALRLALEALESTGENNGYHGVTQYFDETMVEKAITAIKAALEAKDEPAPVAKNEGGRITWMIEDWPQNCLLYTHLPQQEAKDEPVAWAFFFEDGEASNELFDTREQGEKWLLSDDCLWAGSLKPLYTTPPQRKPLTDEEIQDALEAEFLGSDAKRNWQDDLRVARAIEAAHGIKG